MDLITWIYAILKRFLPVSKQEVATLENEAQKWFAENKEKKTGIAPIDKFIIPHIDTWYTKTLLAVLWLFAVKLINDFMANTGTEQEGDEFDD